MNKDIFYDRYGNKHYPGDALPSSKRGYFAVLAAEDKVLVTIPQNTNTMEFPGGNKQRNETPRECLHRKLYEETGVDFELGYGQKEFSQLINYFAEEDKPDGRFFIYDQTFYLYDASAFGFNTMEDKWETPDGSKACWVKMKDIASGVRKINYAHWLAFQELILKD